MTESGRGTVLPQRSLLFRSAAREVGVTSASNYMTITLTIQLIQKIGQSRV